MFYRSPKKSVCADVIPFYEDGEFKLFYLRDYRDIEHEGEGCPWCLLTTKDLVHYVDHGPVLLRGSKDEQDLYVFTGSIYKENGIYYIFYTGHNPHLRKKNLPEQKILLATSKDLLHWDKVKDFVFEAPSYLEKHDFRDPFVYKNEKTGEYNMLLAARAKNHKPINSKGLTLKATSKDLLHWNLEKKPFYAPRAYFTHECPDLFKMGDKFYLAFSEFTDKVLTTYRMSDNIDGPWETPVNNTFNGHAFYAAKSVSDGKRRIMFGWNPIKNNENDNEPWQWGGNIIPQEIYPDPETGELYTKCPQEILDAYSVEFPLKLKNRLGKTRYKRDFISFKNCGYNLVDIGKLPNKCKIDIDFKLRDMVGDFGLIFRGDKKLNKYYSVKIEPKMNRLGYDYQPRPVSFLHTQVDVEKYCPLKLRKMHKMTIILDDSCVQVYVDNKYAMSARAFEENGNYAALYSNNIAVDVYTINVKKLVEE